MPTNVQIGKRVRSPYLLRKELFSGTKQINNVDNNNNNKNRYSAPINKIRNMLIVV